MIEGLLKTLVDVSYNLFDWQRAKKFYTETLGLPVTGFISDDVGWMELGEEAADRRPASRGVGESLPLW